MYKAFLDDICILDASLDIVLEEPKLELADSAAGSFNFTVYQDNPGYAQMQANLMKTSALKVLWEDEVLYKGRITSIKQTWDKALMIESEGDLALLDDTIQRPAEYHELTVIGYVTKLIELHNAKAGSDKQFQVGSITVTDSNDSLYRYTNWESTLTTFKEDLLESLGGHLRVRYDSSGNRLLDYLADYPRVSEQKIEFGSNLLDYSENTDGTVIATVCIPLGARQEETDIEALEKRVTIESVNSGSDELVITQAVNTFGRITKTVTWDNVNTPSILKAKGQKWLQDNQYSEMTLELSAVDLADFGIEADHLRLLDKIRCTSKPHGMDRDFPITEVSLHLLDPEQNVYVLGSKIKGFATGSSRAQKQIQQQLSNQPSKSHVLKLALDNATSLINMTGDDGCVVLSKNEILVMDGESKEEADRLWRWNINGLGYSSNGYQGPFDLAFTMDGTIAGRFIAAHTIGADQISVSYTSEQEKKWQDELGNNYWKATTIQTELKNTADSVTASVKSWAGSQYYTKSEINVTVDGIESTVSKKVGTNEIISKINQSAEGIKISASKFDVDADAIRLKASKLSWSATYSSLTEAGKLTCTSAEISGTVTCGNTSYQWLKLNGSGQLAGGYGSSQYGYVDCSASVTNQDNGVTRHGVQIQGGVLRISTDEISVLNSSNTSSTTIIAATGYLSVVHNMASDMSSCTETSYRFINGLLVSSL